MATIGLDMQFVKCYNFNDQNQSYSKKEIQHEFKQKYEQNIKICPFSRHHRNYRNAFSTDNAYIV